MPHVLSLPTFNLCVPSLFRQNSFAISTDGDNGYLIILPLFHPRLPSTGTGTSSGDEDETQAQPPARKADNPLLLNDVVPTTAIPTNNLRLDYCYGRCYYHNHNVHRERQTACASLRVSPHLRGEQDRQHTTNLAFPCTYFSTYSPYTYACHRGRECRSRLTRNGNDNGAHIQHMCHWKYQPVPSSSSDKRTVILNFDIAVHWRRYI
jgi:hypothetical protein